MSRARRPPAASLPLLVFVLAAAFWSADLAALGGGMPDRLDDSWEYGLVARSLLAGAGFHTPMIIRRSGRSGTRSAWCRCWCTARS